MNKRLVNIQQVKKHLNIDEDYTDDDELLKDLIEDGTYAICADCNRNRDEIEGGTPAMRAIARRALLLKIGDLYRFREGLDTAQVRSIPMAYTRYIDALTNYN